MAFLRKRTLWSIFFSFIFSFSLSQSTQPQQGIFSEKGQIYTFINCKIHTGTGETIPEGFLTVRDGVILAVSEKDDYPAGSIEIDLKGAWVYPGFIDAYSFGPKSKPPAKAGWNAKPQYNSSKKGPFAWNEAIKPENNVCESINFTEKDMTPHIKNGFTTLNINPKDGIIRGNSVLVELANKGETLKSTSNLSMSFNKGSSKQAYPSSLMGSIALIRQTFLDAQWYKSAWTAWELNPAQPKPELNLSLEALNVTLDSDQPIVFELQDHWDLFRAQKIADEFGLNFIYKTTGKEFKLGTRIKEVNQELIIPLVFPEVPDVEDANAAREVSLEQLWDWDSSPANPAFLEKSGITFSLTANGLTKPTDFRKTLLKVISKGLTPSMALKALTITPAKMLKVDDRIGSLEKGKRANFQVYSGDAFKKESKLLRVYVGNSWHDFSPLSQKGMMKDGKYLTSIDDKKCVLEFSTHKETPKLSIFWETDTIAVKAKTNWNGKNFSVLFPSKDKKAKYRLSGNVFSGVPEGTLLKPDGKRISIAFEHAGSTTKKETKKDALSKSKKPELIPSSFHPFSAYGNQSMPEQLDLWITNATVWTNTDEGVLKNATVHLAGGKILAVGKDLTPPSDGKVIDAKGQHMSPGIIDEHSHIAIARGVNESAPAISAEVRIGDVINSDDVNIYRQLSGGVTASQLLHGSANPIGGQSALIKLRWGEKPENMKIKGADGFIKFALGENVKQSNWGDGFNIRYPQTRLGVEQIMRDGFNQASHYRESTLSFNSQRGRIIPIKPNLRYDILLEILDKKRFVTCHSYVQSEITMLMRLAECFGFRINTFTHVLEGYKIADKLKAHGATASTFSDWWAYKYEVIDAIPQNAAIMNKVGINVCINSDDAEMGRRLNQEAAKSIKYGGLSEEEALKLVTLNPAKALHLDHRMGKIQKGMDADIVLWSDNPLSIYAHVNKTFIDGKLYYDKTEAEQKQLRDEIEMNKLVQKALLSIDKGGKKAPPASPKKKFHCDTIESDYNHE